MIFLDVEVARERVHSWADRADRPTGTWSEDEIMALADEYLELTRPGVVFVDPVAGESPAMVLGGDPDLPVDMDWPVGPDGRDLEFVSELVLSELPYLEELSVKSGSLLFFNNHWGKTDDTSYVGLCIYFDASVERSSRSHPPIAVLGRDSDLWTPDDFWGEPSVYAAMPCLTVPDVAWADARQLTRGSPEAEGSLYSIESTRAEFGRSEGHYSSHLLGWADGCQEPIEDQLARSHPGEGWRALLTIHDGVGIGSWSIRQDDLTAGDFNNVIYYWDL